jgi:predicted nucleic acid-binding protein
MYSITRSTPIDSPYIDLALATHANLIVSRDRHLLAQPSHVPTKFSFSAAIFRVGCVAAGVEASKPVW